MPGRFKSTKYFLISESVQYKTRWFYHNEILCLCIFHSYLLVLYDEKMYCIMKVLVVFQCKGAVVIPRYPSAWTVAFF